MTKIQQHMQIPKLSWKICTIFKNPRPIIRMIHLIYFNINVKSNQIILFAHNNLTVNVKGFYAHCTCKNDSKL